MTSREAAEEALRESDWSRAWDYLAELNGTPSTEEAWLSAMEGAALGHAEAGDLRAQQTLGSLGIFRYLAGRQLDPEVLRKGLRWIVVAQRQSPVDVGLDMLVLWYRGLRAHGERDAEIEAFLSQPETKEQYRRLRGVDPLSE